MSEQKVINIDFSLPVAFLLTVTLVFLKINNYVTWSWLWIFSPIWIPFAIFIMLIAVSAVIALLIFILEEFTK
jgi:hypothetical protein